MQQDFTAPSRASALTQTSTDATSDRFPLYIYNRFTGKDVAFVDSCTRREGNTRTNETQALDNS